MINVRSKSVILLPVTLICLHTKFTYNLFWHINLNTEQNGLNIMLDSWNLVHKPRPMKLHINEKKKKKILFLG